MHEVQEEHGQFHYEVCVVHVRPLALPGPGVVEVPQVDGVSGWEESKYIPDLSKIKLHFSISWRSGKIGLYVSKYNKYTAL